jgi:hypothetical protein
MFLNALALRRKLVRLSNSLLLIFSCGTFFFLLRHLHERCSDVLSRPELIHPFASAIDTPLEAPETMVSSYPSSNILLQGQGVALIWNFQTCVKLNSKPDYVRLPEGKKEVHEDYGNDSIEGWHKKHGFFKE